MKEEVTKDWRVDEERSRLAKYTDDLVKWLIGGKTLEDLAKDLNGQVLTTEPLKRNGMTVNVLPNAVAQAFTLAARRIWLGALRRRRGAHRVSGRQGHAASPARRAEP